MNNKTKILIGIFLSVLMWSILTPAQDSSSQRDKAYEAIFGKQHIALVIGNANYKVGPLRNPLNDSQDMALALRGLGFDVVQKNDLTRDEMRKEIKAFGQRLKNKKIGLFYFAGHGIQVKGINYLIPIDAEIENEEQVEYEAIQAEMIVAEMEGAKSRTNIVILDACRNNPFARSVRSSDRGLAAMEAPTGTIIGFATAPGKVASDGPGRNGLYTSALLTYINSAGLKIEDFFKKVRVLVLDKSNNQQRPWEAASLVEDFYFKPTTVVANIPRDAPPPSNDKPTLLDEVLKSHKNQTTPVDSPNKSNMWMWGPVVFQGNYNVSSSPDQNSNNSSGNTRFRFRAKAIKTKKDGDLAQASRELSNNSECHVWDDIWYYWNLPVGDTLLLAFMNLDTGRYGWVAIKKNSDSWVYKTNNSQWQSVFYPWRKKEPYWIDTGYRISLGFEIPTETNTTIKYRFGH